MDLFDKMKKLLDKEHSNELGDNKVMLSILWERKEDTGVVFANGGDECIAFIILLFLRNNPEIMKVMVKQILEKDDSEVLQ